MYYPYLRAKQYEMLALRDFIQYNTNDCGLMPILEPVKTTFNSLRLLLEAYKRANKKVGIVLNPEVGDLVGRKEIIESELDKFRDYYQPVFIISSSNIANIATYLSTGNYRDVILLIPHSLTDEGNDLEELATSPYVTTIIIKDPQRSIKRALQKLSKKIVVLYDFFTKQEKNVDYLDVGEEFYTEEYWYYREEKFDGISDYTVLPSMYIEGGRLPYAVAIHLTYVKADKVNIRHFVSDSNDDTSNIQGKFAEAAKKAIEFCQTNKIASHGIDQLVNSYNEQHYPGLGSLKKISILHHLELVSNIISKLQ